MDYLDIVFLHVLYASLMGSALLLLLLLVKKIFYNSMGARFHHIIWILVLIRLVMPVAPESKFSIFNILPEKTHMLTEEQVHNNAPRDLTGKEENGSTAGDIHPQIGDNTTEITEKSYYQMALRIFSRVWFLGFLFTIAFYLVMVIRFKRGTRDLKKLEDPGVQLLMRQCLDKLKIKRPVSVYLHTYFKSPCISGIINPRIYLPADMCSVINHNQLEHIVLHELAHYKRKDLFYSYFSTLVASIHWFNPLVWLGVRQMRFDREIACDAYVMDVLGEKEIILYGMTILNLSKILSNGYRQLSLESFFETNSQLEKRIRMLKTFKKGSYKLSALMLICLLLIGAVTLTNSVGTKKNSDSMANTNKEKLVVIDPGHGGFDTGAIFTDKSSNKETGSVKEKDLNLAISVKLYEMLKTSGIRAVLTRKEDHAVDLKDRVELANGLSAALFVSVHINAGKTENETLTLYNQSANDHSSVITGERAAQIIQGAVAKNLGEDGGIRKFNNSMVFNNNKMPTVSTQIAYISKDDRPNFTKEDLIAQAAESLHEGIIKTLDQLDKKTPE